MKCKYCGCSNAEYYNELANIYYCHNCFQIAIKEWFTRMYDIVDWLNNIEMEENS